MRVLLLGGMLMAMISLSGGVAGVVLSLLVTGLAAGVAAAQQVDATVSPPPREHGVSGIIEHGLQYELTRPDDSSYAPPGPRVHHDPAFIEPLSVATQTTTTTGRMGIAGWTSPSVTVASPGSGGRDVTGYFALGFAIEWGGPPPSKRPVH